MKLLRCKEATLLASQSLDRKLSFRERLSLQLHLLICVACQRFRRQIEFLRAAVRQGVQQLDQAMDLELSVPARERIRRALDERRT